MVWTVKIPTFPLYAVPAPASLALVAVESSIPWQGIENVTIPVVGL